MTFLGHEGQHFADKTRFKKLKDWELEYRAKLTELAQANVTRSKVLGKFITDQGDDPASPHSYANRQVLTDLVEELQLRPVPTSSHLWSVAAVQAAAVELLCEDSAARVSARPREGIEGYPALAGMTGYRHDSRYGWSKPNCLAFSSV